MIKGQRDYEKFIRGQKLSPLKSIKAHCYICNGAEEGEEIDCNGKSCPLYRFMPYRQNRIKKHIKL